MKVYGVVVLYNPDKKLKKNIETYIDGVEKLYLVDNTPDADNSKDFSGNKKIEYIPLKKNMGIAYALNYAAKLAIKEGAEWLLTMDQDSKFKDKTGVQDMLRFLEECKNNKYMDKVVGNTFEEIGIVSPFHCTERNQGEVLPGFTKPIEVMTSGNLVNLKAYKKVGGFKDWLFIDCVDFDFCMELRKKDYEVIQLSWVKLLHELGDLQEVKWMGKKTYTDNHSAFRRYFMTRNRFYLFDLHADRFYGFCIKAKHDTRKEIIKILLYENDKFKKLRETYRGYRDYKKGIKGGYHGKN